MNMQPSLIAELGDELLAALQEGRSIAPLTERYPDLGVDDAYRISRHVLARREALGEKVVGKKVGATSAVVQQMLDVHAPDFGFLTDAMQYPDDSAISLSRCGLIQPRVEGEIVFKLKADLTGPGVTREAVLAATEWVAPGFEIVDSRIDDWQIRMADTVADNASCGLFIVGERRTSPDDVDLASLRMELCRNGEPAGSGIGAALQGHPAESVVWLANTLCEMGIPLRAGELVLSGSMGHLTPVRVGDRLALEIDILGGCSVRFVR